MSEVTLKGGRKAGRETPPPGHEARPTVGP